MVGRFLRAASRDVGSLLATEKIVPGAAYHELFRRSLVAWSLHFHLSFNLASSSTNPPFEPMSQSTSTSTWDAFGIQAETSDTEFAVDFVWQELGRNVQCYILEAGTGVFQREHASSLQTFEGVIAGQGFSLPYFSPTSPGKRQWDEFRSETRIVLGTRTDVPAVTALGRPIRQVMLTVPSTHQPAWSVHLEVE